MAERLDVHLVAAGLVASRARARDLIGRGLVSVDGHVAMRAAQQVHGHEQILVDPIAASYVSRGAEKLVAALQAFKFEAHGRTCLDLGASTGGFVDVLLRRGATRVFAVDVGSGQLHPSLARDERVVSLEDTDARALAPSVIHAPIQAVTIDVSFVSITKVAGPALQLAEAGAWLVALIKPQFEVGPDHVCRGGIVRDAGARDRAVADIARWVDMQPGWRLIDCVPSPILGGDGNTEMLLGAVRDG
ncbi:MAG: TlyA family RNA methyltransferase [Pseudomonadota bacterium]